MQTNTNSLQNKANPFNRVTALKIRSFGMLGVYSTTIDLDLMPVDTKQLAIVKYIKDIEESTPLTEAQIKRLVTEQLRDPVIGKLFLKSSFTLDSFQEWYNRVVDIHLYADQMATKNFKTIYSHVQKRASNRFVRIIVQGKYQTMKSTKKNQRIEKGIRVTVPPVKRSSVIWRQTTKMVVDQEQFTRAMKVIGQRKNYSDQRRMVALCTLWVLYFTNLKVREIRFVTFHNIWELVNKNTTTVLYFKRPILVNVSRQAVNSRQAFGISGIIDSQMFLSYNYKQKKPMLTNRTWNSFLVYKVFMDINQRLRTGFTRKNFKSPKP